MKFPHKVMSLTLGLICCFSAKAKDCRLVNDAEELASIRSEAQLVGNYAQGWLLEKPGPGSGSLRCKPIENSESQSCAKQGRSNFITMNRDQELLSGLIIQSDSMIEFLIKPDGQFECPPAPATTHNDHNPDDSDNKLSGGIILAFEPATNNQGFCQPERVDIVDTEIEGKRLLSIRGSARYTLPLGTTEIPFQSVHKYPDQSGFSDTDAIIGLNYEGACADLTIDMKIKYCEYSNEGFREKGPCPDFQIRGAAGFEAVNLERRDLR